MTWRGAVAGALLMGAAGVVPALAADQVPPWVGHRECEREGFQANSAGYNACMRAAQAVLADDTNRWFQDQLNGRRNDLRQSPPRRVPPAEIPRLGITSCFDMGSGAFSCFSQ